MSDLNTRPIVVTKDARGRAENRRYPFRPTKITATSEVQAQLLFECPRGEIAEFANVNLSNVTSDDQRVSIYVVPEGETLSDEHLVLGALQIKANSADVFKSAILLFQGWRLYAFADSASAIRVSGWILAHL